ncbi:MAG: glutamate racemase, partial [Candidatus Krumholzibacteria bacterium]|nr:glutamate racemase [Candidatus Krumholzibacteria bacterium]
GLLRDGAEPGQLTFYLSDIPWVFAEVGARFLGRPIAAVQTVNLDELEAEGRLAPVGKGGAS